MANKTGDRPELVVQVCSHGKKNDGGFSSVPEGDQFSFPACGRNHTATQDKYEISSAWLQDQEETRIMIERAAIARAALEESRR